MDDQPTDFRSVYKNIPWTTYDPNEKDVLSFYIERLLDEIDRLRAELASLRADMGRLSVQLTQQPEPDQPAKWTTSGKSTVTFHHVNNLRPTWATGVYALCQECGKEFQIISDDGANNTTACWNECPHCKFRNPLWLRFTYPKDIVAELRARNPYPEDIFPDIERDDWWNIDTALEDWNNSNAKELPSMDAISGNLNRRGYLIAVDKLRHILEERKDVSE